MFTFWNVFIHILPLIAILVFLIRRRYQYWERKGLKGPFPVFPIGYYWQRARVCPKKLELEWFKKYGRIYGVYSGIAPVLTISDANLIKQVLVKDFHLFVNRRDLQSYDHIWMKNLFVVDQNDWKRIRAITSPAFTSGKLRQMYPHIKKALDKLKFYFSNKSNSEDRIFKVKDIMVGFTMDVIASTSFGIQTDSNNDRKTVNPFNLYGQKFFNPSRFDMVATGAFPRWMLRILNIPHQFPRDAFDFFVEVSRQILQNKNRKNTLAGILQEASISEEELKDMNYNKLTATDQLEKNSTEEQTNSLIYKKLTETEVIAQCILFINAGFETTSSALTHGLFELAAHPDIQERLYNEVKELYEIYENQNDDLVVFYDKIMTELPYLDAVVKEILRMYPTVYRLERRVSVDGYKLGGVELDKETLVEISTAAVHYDPEYYPEPYRFNPDRFMPENKHLLTPYTYLPFGEGPRNCVGMRFGIQEVKFALSHLIRHFKYEKCSETPSELSYIVGSPVLLSKPFKLSISSR